MYVIPGFSITNESQSHFVVRNIKFVFQNLEIHPFYFWSTLFTDPPFLHVLLKNFWPHPFLQNWIFFYPTLSKGWVPHNVPLRFPYQWLLSIRATNTPIVDNARVKIKTYLHVHLSFQFTLELVVTRMSGLWWFVFHIPLRSTFIYFSLLLKMIHGSPDQWKIIAKPFKLNSRRKWLTRFCHLFGRFCQDNTW